MDSCNLASADGLGFPIIHHRRKWPLWTLATPTLQWVVNYSQVLIPLGPPRKAPFGVCAGHFLSTWYKRESYWKGKPQLRRCPQHTGLWASLWCIFLMGDGCGRPSSLVIWGSGSTSQEVQPVSRTPPWLWLQLLLPGSCLSLPCLSSCPGFPQWWAVLWNCKLK